MNLGRLLLGLLVMAVGVVFLLDGLDVLEAGPALAAAWPAALIAVGAVQLVEQRRLAVGPLIVIGVGLLLLGSTTGIAPLDWGVLWPLALVGLGVWLLVHRSSPDDTAASVGDHRVQATAVLAGHELRSTSRAFEGGSLTALLGGVDLDLRDAQLAEGGATLDVTAILGGVELTVPEGWRVDVRATSILGGFDDDRRRAPTAEDAPTLTITGLLLLGGGDITT